MKQKILKTSLIMTLLIMYGTILFAQVIDEKDLPKEIQSYVQIHFPESQIIFAVKDKEGLSYKYELKLNNRVELDFNAQGEIISIEGKEKLPDSVIPVKILSYVQKKFPKNYITDWSLKKRKQEIELDNGLELKFNNDGDFIKMDD